MSLASVTEFHLGTYPKLASYTIVASETILNIDPKYKFDDPEDLYLDMENKKYQNETYTIPLKSNNGSFGDRKCEFIGFPKSGKMNLFNIECRYDCKSYFYIIYFKSLDISFCFGEPKIYTKEKDTIVFDFSKGLRGDIFIIKNWEFILTVSQNLSIEYYKRANILGVFVNNFDSDGSRALTVPELRTSLDDNFVINIYGEEYYCAVSDLKTELCDAKRNVLIISHPIVHIECFDDVTIFYGEESTFYINQNDWKSLKTSPKQEHQLILRQFSNLQGDEFYFYTNATFLSNPKISLYVLISDDANMGTAMDVYQFSGDRLVKILNIFNTQNKAVVHQKMIAENIDEDSKVTLMDNGNLVVKGIKKSFTFQLA